METSLHFGLLFNIDRTDTMTIYARARYIFDKIWSLVPGKLGLSYEIRIQAIFREDTCGIFLGSSLLFARNKEQGEKVAFKQGPQGRGRVSCVPLSWADLWPHPRWEVETFRRYSTRSPHASEDNNLRMQISVFAVTATFSIFAYLWLIIILKVSSPDVVDLWEAVLTFIFFPTLVLIAYCADKGWVNKYLFCQKDDPSAEAAKQGQIELGNFQPGEESMYRTSSFCLLDHS